MAKMTALQVKGLKDAGRYGDGDGLYLVVSKSGARSWVVRCQKDGRRRDVGLGSASKVSLANARQAARATRAQMAAGIDPVAERAKSKGIPTLRQAAAVVYGEQRKGWKNQKHNAQWISSLEQYAFPKIGDRSIADIDMPAVHGVLEPIWQDKHETARRVLQRLSAIIDWSISKGYRQHALPLSALKSGLGRVSKSKKHHMAMPHDHVPTFFAALQGKGGAGALALQFVILTAARSGEAREATWAEIDLDKAVWTIPAGRMKADREHKVPLTKAALAVLTAAKALQIGGSDYIFQGQRKCKPLSDMTLTKIMRDMGRTETVHGFRSSFRDWAAEKTDVQNEVAEMALAHTISSKTEAAYRRGDLFDKRVALMDAWGLFCRSLNGK